MDTVWGSAVLRNEELLPCPAGSLGIRESQCSQYNNQVIAGKFIKKWIPANGGPNPCELRCEAVPEKLVYGFGKATDGTPCTLGVCLDGRCLRVGCDDRLGSGVTLDMCGVCGGRNSNCVHYKDVYQGQASSGSAGKSSYHEVVVIPVTARNLIIRQPLVKNILALQDRSKGIIFNREQNAIKYGGHFEIAGSPVEFLKLDDVAEELIVKGPLNQELYVLNFSEDTASRAPVAPPQSAIYGLEISTITSSAIVFFLWFFKKRSVMSRRKQQSAFDQVSEFDRGRIVAYLDCGLSFREIGSRVGRNQTTVMRICDRCMQESTTDRRGRSHPPQCTTSREDRQIVRMAVTDRSVTSRTVTQHIESVTHHSLSARTIRRFLLQSGLSARRPLLDLPLTQNHRRLRRQWCEERRMWVAEWNAVVFTDESRICLQHSDGRIRVWRHHGERMLNSCFMHRHTGPAPGIMVWGGIGYHSRTPLVRIAGTLNSQRYISEVLEPVVLPYLQGLVTAIFQQDNARPRIVQRFFVNHQIELLELLPD
ncbi:ADAMTS-like protein 5 [Trichonephila clavipes]|nr:ADAMTS-like protein 5 [Trichonephila clavipes]